MLSCNITNKKKHRLIYLALLIILLPALFLFIFLTQPSYMPAQGVNAENTSIPIFGGVFKYALEGMNFTFAIITLMMYLKNKRYTHFLLLSLSGLIRMFATEFYLSPSLLADCLDLSSSWTFQLPRLLIAVACTLNVGVIYTLYKKYMYKKMSLSVLIIVNIFLLISLITSNTISVRILNISGYLLYLICLIAVVRAYSSGEKSAGYIFTSFYIYMVSLLFFFITRWTVDYKSMLFNAACPVGEILFYGTTVFAFFERYIHNYIHHISQIQSLDEQLSGKERSLQEAYDKLRKYEAARTRMLILHTTSERPLLLFLATCL